MFFVFNGTAANSLALASLCRSYHSVICHELAHVETDECGAPEFFSNGTKLLHVNGPGGKFDLAEVERVITRRSDIHYPCPKVLSLTQATEVGTVYTPDEIRAASELARRHGMRVQMDGARFANAVVSLNVAPAEITWRAGVDVLCLGGAKNGMAVGEAVVFLIVSWPMNLTIAANRPGSWRPRCALFRHPGSGCSKVAPGSKTPVTPMIVPRCWKSIWPVSTASASCIRGRPTRCSSRCRKRLRRPFGLPAGTSIHSSDQEVRASCVRGRQRNVMYSSWLRRSDWQLHC